MVWEIQSVVVVKLHNLFLKFSAQIKTKQWYSRSEKIYTIMFIWSDITEINSKAVIEFAWEQLRNKTHFPVFPYVIHF